MPSPPSRAAVGRGQHDLAVAGAGRHRARRVGEVAGQPEGAAVDGQPARLLVEVGDDLVVGKLAAHAPTVWRRAARLLVSLAGELGALERRGILRIGHLFAGELGEGGELAPAAVARGGGDLLVDVVGEELKGRGLAVLLAHEEHRRERRQQRAERGERAGRGREAVAEGAVADLVVVLVEDDELRGRAVAGRRAEAALAKRR